MHPDADQYRSWIDAGHYTCVLFDGSILQMTYNISGRKISGHRLAYAPCPWVLDTSLLEGGEPLSDILDAYRNEQCALRSPVRIDYDPTASRAGHPSVHLTFNSVDCRIACIAPISPHRFADFIFKHFYNDYWHAHRVFFQTASASHIGEPTITDEDSDDIHMAWNSRLQVS
ncbi:DUF2290 domain-containing protein [Nocardia kruczakiae]